jgi:hypothetical protein
MVTARFSAIFFNLATTRQPVPKLDIVAVNELAGIFERRVIIFGDKFVRVSIAAMMVAIKENPAIGRVQRFAQGNKTAVINSPCGVV